MMTFNAKHYPLVIALGLIATGVTMRLLPHPANFAPITAIAIFGGSVLPKKVSIWIPLGAMVVSDAIIGFYALMPLIWACYVAIALASSRWLRPATLGRGVKFTLASSLFFFLVTNFGVWVTSGMYAHSWAGLTNCYVLALPFFRNSFLSDICYTGALFSAYVLATNGFTRDKKIENQVHEKTPLAF